MSLRDEVEKRLPNWASWYPSVFDAARDLGLIRARVCAPSSLLLSNRHCAVQAEAEAAHRDKWGGPEDLETVGTSDRKRRRGRSAGPAGRIGLDLVAPGREPVTA